METGYIVLLSVIGVVTVFGMGYLAGKVDERTLWNKLIEDGVFTVREFK